MSVPVVSVAQMREWEESTWASGQAVDTVMRQAGRAVAECAMRMTRSGDAIVVLAGKGNNGGDAKYAAEYTKDRKVFLIDASNPVDACSEFTLSKTPRLIIDGLFGIGLNRALNEEWISLIDAVNKSEAPVLAVDSPSGLNCDTGEVMGAAIRAAVTVTFAAPKTGLIGNEFAEHVGKLYVADRIGLIDCPFDGDLRWTLPGDFTNFPNLRPDGGHKGTFGHLAILAGSLGFHGAAVLAARAAHRAMPGLVSLFTTKAAHPLVASQLQQTMVHPFAGKLPDNASAILVGPGLAGPDVTDELIEFVRTMWLETPLPMIVDASALDWLPRGAHASAPRVITPHPGEAARLLQIPNTKVQQDRVKAAANLREHYDCQVVLKGRQTLVRGLTGTTHINSTGNSGLGQGGSGDVLAGYLAGLLAQPLLRDDLDRLIRFGVWEHGCVADQLAGSRYAWDLEDLVPLLGNSRLKP